MGIEDDIRFLKDDVKELRGLFFSINDKLDKLLEKKQEVNRPDIPVLKETLKEDVDDIAKYLNR